MDNAALGVLTEKLVQFGLTRQEANIYMCLLRNKDLSGYEVSKLTGISRSNVYSALAALVDEGGGISHGGGDKQIYGSPNRGFLPE